MYTQPQPASNRALERIEEFTEVFLRRVQRCGVGSSALVYVGVPRSHYGRKRRVPWEFPSSRKVRMLQWGTSGAHSATISRARIYA